MMNVTNIQDPIQLHNLWTGSFKETLQRLIDLANSSTPHYHCSINALTLYWLNRHQEFRQAIMGADLVTPDGASILWAQKLWNIRFKERLPGIDLAGALLKHAQREQWRVAFINPRIHLLQELKQRLSLTHPNLQISTHLFSDNASDISLIAKNIQQQQTKIVFLGLQMPTQEIWMHRNKYLLSAPLLMGIGGGLEVLAGLQKRAPQFWQRAHAEWLYRFLREPRRRWRATWRSTGPLIWQLLKWKLDKIDKS